MRKTGLIDSSLPSMIDFLAPISHPISIVSAALPSLVFKATPYKNPAVSHAACLTSYYGVTLGIS